MEWIIKSWVVLVSLYVFFKLYGLIREEKTSGTPLSSLQKLHLAITGFIGNVADTIGIGSFAVMVACDKHWDLVDDKKLPGTLNAQSILPTMVQALFFLQAVSIDTATLVTLVIGASLGGFFGGFFVAGLNKQMIRRLMFLGYIGIALLLIAHKANLLPVGGDALSLTGSKLLIGFIGMLLVGALPAIGVGAYAPTQVVLFLLGMGPIAAFPIMSTAGAIQQSVAALAFIMKRQVAAYSSWIIGLAGIAGVLVAAPFIAVIHPETLRWLLLTVIVYNIVMLARSSRKTPELQAA